MKEYNKNNLFYARELRKNMTPWERKLWYAYLSKYPIRFQRQKMLGNYIADFYCAKAKLVIELDGGGHYEEHQVSVDLQRTEKLEETGLRVLRICNLDIDRNFRGVCEMIDLQVQQSLPQSACSADSPLLRGGREGGHK
ncbi:MAG: endonuclease domain-containing protein [Ruminococcaceae bacterium]|nr:endonuclease domain-containing protein [Oscillospiraceae bacterium]